MKELEVVNIIELAQTRNKNIRPHNFACYDCKRSRDCVNAFTDGACYTQDRSLAKFHKRKALA